MTYAIGYRGFMVQYFVSGSLQMIRGAIPPGAVAVPVAREDQVAGWYISADGFTVERAA